MPPLPSTSSSLPPKSIIPPGWEVPKDFRQRVGEKAGRQRAMLAEGHLLLVLHRPPKKDEVERNGRLFWRKPDGTWQSNDFGNGLAALNKHLAEYAEIVDRFDQQEDDAVGVDALFAILEAMGPIQRSSRNLHATLQEARKLLANDRDLINIRDKAYEIERTAELLYHDVQNAMEFAVAKQTERQATAAHQMARSSHRLNLLVAFFFPIATLTAVFGTNLEHNLEAVIKPPYAFYSVIGIGLLLGSVMCAYLIAVSRAAKGN